MKNIRRFLSRFLRKNNGRNPKRNFTHTQQVEMFERQLGKCADCNNSLSLRTVVYHHVKPYSEGGFTTINNGVALCPNCHAARTFAWNMEKADRSREEIVEGKNVEYNKV